MIQLIVTEPINFYPGEQGETPTLEEGYSTEGWYYWESARCFCYGPYKNNQAARQALQDHLNLQPDFCGDCHYEGDCPEESLPLDK